MEQLVARRAHNPKVVGSSPAPATSSKRPQVKRFEAFFVFSVLLILYIQLNSVSCPVRHKKVT